jgi:hypothetical protein
MGIITRTFANDIVAKSKAKTPLNIGTDATPISTNQNIDISGTNFVNVLFNENITLTVTGGRFGFAYGDTIFRLVNKNTTEAKLCTISTGEETYTTAYIPSQIEYNVAVLIIARIENRLVDRNFEYPNQSWRTFGLIENDGSTIIKAYQNGQFAISTNGQPATIQLPTVALEGMVLSILDADGTANTHNITVDRNGHNINGTASNLVLTLSRASITLVYLDETNGWVFRDYYPGS